MKDSALSAAVCVVGALVGALVVGGPDWERAALLVGGAGVLGSWPGLRSWRKRPTP